MRSLRMELFYSLLMALLLSGALHASLLSGITTHILGGGDAYQFIWNFWYFSCKFHEGQDVFLNNFQGYPLGSNLAYHSYMPFIGLISIPILPVLGALGVYNFWLFSGTILAFLATYWLARNHDSTPMSSTFAALTFALAPAVTCRHEGHLNLSFAGMIPLCFLFLEKLIQVPNLIFGITFGFVITMTLGVDYYLVFYVAILVALRLLLESKRQNWSIGLTLSLAVSFITILIFSWPILWNIIHNSGQYSEYLGSVGESASVFDYIIPAPNSLLWHHIVGIERPVYRSGIEHCIFVGYICLFLSLFSVCRKICVNKLSFSRFWLFITIGSVVLSLGKEIQCFGVRIPLPYQLISSLPFVQGFRVSSRFSIVAMLGLSILSGRSFLVLHGKKRIFMFILCMILIVLELFPIRSARSIVHLESMRQIDAESGKFCVLSLPLGWKAGTWSIGSCARHDLLFQISHEKYILSLNVARAIGSRFRGYFLNLPFAKKLLDIQNGVHSLSESDRELLRYGIGFFDIRYVVLDNSLFNVKEKLAKKMNPVQLQNHAYKIHCEMLKFIDLIGPGEKIEEKHGYTVYRLPRPQAEFLRGGAVGALSLDFYFWVGPGWKVSSNKAVSRCFELIANEATLFFPMSSGKKPYLLGMEIESKKQASVHVRDQLGLIETILVEKGKFPYVIEIPPERTEEPLKKLFLITEDGENISIHALSSSPKSS